MAKRPTARNLRLLSQHARTGFVFERENLLSALVEFRKLFDTDPARLKKMADDAFQNNRQVIDMDECVRPLIAIFRDHRAHQHDSKPGVADNGAGVF